MNVQQPIVTVLIPNYRTPQITRICLRLLRLHSDFRKIKVIVIDNGSNDESLSYLRSLSWIKLIERSPEPDDTNVLSHSRALDLALNEVETPYVLSIHTDTFIKKREWLEVLLKPMIDSPLVAGVGSWKLEHKNFISRVGRKIEEWFKKIIYYTLNFKTYEDQRFDENYHYLRSHCALYRMDVIRKLKTSFSDENQVAGLVMHRKMKEAGYEMVFLPSKKLSTFIDHLNHATLILNPDLGSKDKSIRKGRRKIQKKLRGIDADAILNNSNLDI